MRIELLVVPDCPHEEAAGALLRRALNDVGLGSQSFGVVVVESLSVAERRHFLGSPTFTVEGRDLFDVPGLRDLRQVLKEAAALAAPASL